MVSTLEWPTTSIRNITLRTRTWNPQAEPRDKIRYVDVSAVSRETLEIESADEIAAAKAPSRARKIVKNGDTIFATIRPNLKRVAQIPATYDNEIASTAFCVLRPDASVVDPDFLYFLASSDAFVEEVASFETGASYPAVRDSDILDREIRLPPVPYQRDIASVLRTVRSATLNQSNSLAVAQDLKRAAMRILFARGLRDEAQKETDIGPVPESWDVVDFGSVRDWLQYGTSTPCGYSPTEYPVLRIPNIEAGRVNSEDIKYGKLRPDDADRYRLENGDLIFIRTNGVIERLGTCAVFAGQPKGALFASYLIRGRLKLDRVVPYFLAQFFASERGISIVAGRATPAADGKYNLNTGTIDGLPIPLPQTLDEQREIISVLNAIDHKIDLHKRKRAVLDELFKSLLHKLMTGEIRVADLDLSALGKAPLEGVAA